MSLRDQLLKAGLVSKKQAQKVEASNRKQGHDSKKNKELADALQAEKQLELDKIEEKVQLMKVPLEFAEHVYSLRGHIDFVRSQLKH